MKKTNRRRGAMAELLSKQNNHGVKETPVMSAEAQRRLQMKKRNDLMREMLLSEEDLGGAEVRVKAEAQVQAPVQTHVQAPVKAPQREVPRMAPQPQVKAAPKQVRPQPAPQRKEQKKQTVAAATFVRPSKKRLRVAAAAVGAVVLATVCIVLAVMLSLSSEETKKAPEIGLGAVSGTPKKGLTEVSLSPVEGSTTLQHVSFNIFGADPLSCLTGESTVSGIVEEMGIELSENQVIREDGEAKTKDGMIISVDTITYGTDTVTEYTDYGTQYYDVRTIPKGTTQTYSAGVKGEVVHTYTITYVNGVETAREKTAETVTKQAKDAVVYRGVGGYITVGGKQYSYSYYIDCKTTVYCLEGITASGKPVGYDVIAVDPSVIPLGTKVFVDDPYTYVGFREAADTGGAIKGNFIDIWFKKGDPNFSAYGVRRARVYILD